MTPMENPWLQRAMGFVKSVLGLKEIVQGGALIGVGLLVMFAGEFTHYVVGAIMLLYGGYMIAGGRL